MAKTKTLVHGGTQAALFTEWLAGLGACGSGLSFVAGRTVLEAWRDPSADGVHLRWLVRKLRAEKLLSARTWARIDTAYWNCLSYRHTPSVLRAAAPEPQLLFRRLKDGSVSATWRTGR